METVFFYFYLSDAKGIINARVSRRNVLYSDCQDPAEEEADVTPRRLICTRISLSFPTLLWTIRGENYKIISRSVRGTVCTFISAAVGC